jgi:hypothetical protein
METQFKVLSENADSYLEIWRAMNVVLESGELRPGHLRAIKPEKNLHDSCTKPNVAKAGGLQSQGV